MCSGSKVLFVLCCAVSTSIWGQTEVADSLKSRLEHLKKIGATDSIYLAVLNDYIYNLQYLNPDSALLLGEQSRLRSQQINFKRGYLEATRNIGIVHYLKGNFVKALDYFFDALKVAEEIKDQRGEARIHNNIGLIYYGEGE